jgi:hypothetical protein
VSGPDRTWTLSPSTPQTTRPVIEPHASVRCQGTRRETALKEISMTIDAIVAAGSRELAETEAGIERVKMMDKLVACLGVS